MLFPPKALFSNCVSTEFRNGTWSKKKFQSKDAEIIHSHIYVHIYTLDYPFTFYICMHTYTHTRIYMFEDWLKSSYDHILPVDDFLPMGSKNSHTNIRSMWNLRRAILKNKPHLITFHEDGWLFCLMKIQLLRIGEWVGDLYNFPFAIFFNRFEVFHRYSWVVV